MSNAWETNDGGAGGLDGFVIGNTGDTNASPSWSSTAYSILCWFSSTDVAVPTCVYEQGGGTNNMAINVGIARAITSQAADAGEDFLIAQSNFLAEADRAYCVLHTWEHHTQHAGATNRISLYVNGVLQQTVEGDSVTANFPNHSGNISVGNANDALQSYNGSTQNFAARSKRVNMLGLLAGSAIDAATAREIFERSVVPDVTIAADTVANQQAALDALIGNAYAGTNLAIRIVQATDAASYRLFVDSIDFTEDANLRDIAIQYVGPNTLTLEPCNGSNPVEVSSPAEVDLDGTTVLPGGGSLVVDARTILRVNGSTVTTVPVGAYDKIVFETSGAFDLTGTTVSEVENVSGAAVDITIDSGIATRTETDGTISVVDSVLTFSGVQTWEVYASQADANAQSGALGSGGVVDTFAFVFDGVGATTYFTRLVSAGGATVFQQVTPATAGTTPVSIDTAALLTLLAGDVSAVLEDTGTTIPTQIAALPTLDAAGVRSALGVATPNLDTQLGALQTETSAAARAAQTQVEHDNTQLAIANLPVPLTAVQVNAEVDTAIADAALATAAGLNATQAALVAEHDETLAAVGAGSVDAASIRAAIGLSSANLDTQLDALQTEADAATRAASDASAHAATLAAVGALPVPLTAAQVNDQCDIAIGDAGLATASGLTTAQAALQADHATTLAAVGAVTPLDAAGVRAAVGLASDNLDAQLGDLETEASAATRATADQAAHAATLAAVSAQSSLSAADVRAAVGLASANLDTQLGSLETEAAAATRSATNIAEHDATQASVALLETETSAAARHAADLLGHTTSQNAIGSGITINSDDGAIKLFAEYFLQPSLVDGAGVGDVGVAVFIARSNGQVANRPTSIDNFEVFDTNGVTSLFTLNNGNFAPHAEAQYANDMLQAIIPSATFAAIIDNPSGFYYVNITATDGVSTVTQRKRLIFLQSQTANDGSSINARVFADNS
ncbi:MAG: hypothetical protein AAFP15_12220 [Bacteroidota bacterium]